MTDEVDPHVEKRYQLVAKLGKGAYGVVWRALDLKTKNGVALKKLFDAFSNQTDAQRTYREVMFLQRINHDNIIKVLNVMRADNRMDLYLVFELMETDLDAVIRCNILQPIHKQYVTYQLVRAIRYLHSVEILHRDLKPANLLLNSDCFMKLADFGLARSLVTLKKEQESRPVLTDYIATRWYRPPEVVLGTVEYTKAVDMWAVGCIVAEMLLGRPVFPGSSTMNQMERIIAGVGTPSKDDIVEMKSAFAEELLDNLPPIASKPLKQVFASQPKEAVDFIGRLLQFNPKKRLTALEAMQDPYIVSFCSPEELKEIEEAMDRPSSIPTREPITLHIPDFSRLTVDEYRDALHLDIAKRKKELRKRKMEKKAKKVLKEQKLAQQVMQNNAVDEPNYEDEAFED